MADWNVNENDFDDMDDDDDDDEDDEFDDIEDDYEAKKRWWGDFFSQQHVVPHHNDWTKFVIDREKLKPNRQIRDAEHAWSI